MKKNLLLSAAVLLTISLNAQSYLLSFSGTGASTTVDSVKIENITQGKSLTIPGTDVLSLNLATGINQIKADVSKALKVYPNPSSEYATMEFYVPDAGITTISIYNLLGSTVAQFRSELSEGMYTYQVEGLGTGLYTIQVASQTDSYTGRILSYQIGQAIPGISFIKYLKADKKVHSLKNGSPPTMQYSAGDRLIFTGYSGTFKTKGAYVISGSRTVSFEFLACSDPSNYNYAIVPINGQIWMAENLRASEYNESTFMHLLTDTTKNSPAYTWYIRPDYTTAGNYGALYNWLAVSTGKICPQGWRVASEYDWNSLESALGMNAGGKLKAINNWANPNYGATDETGFAAMPGGICDNNYFQVADKYKMLDSYGYWWTSTPIAGGDLAYYHAMSSETATIFSYTNDGYRKSKYFSVRCIKNYGGEIN